MLCFIFKCIGKPSQVFKQQAHLFYVPRSLAFPWGRKPGGKGSGVNLGQAFRGYGSRHAQSLHCRTLYNPIDCSPPGSSVHGILQARILEWVANALLQGIFLGIKPMSPVAPALQADSLSLSQRGSHGSRKEMTVAWTRNAGMETEKGNLSGILVVESWH